MCPICYLVGLGGVMLTLSPLLVRLGWHGRQRFLRREGVAGGWQSDPPIPRLL